MLGMDIPYNNYYRMLSAIKIKQVTLFHRFYMKLFFYNDKVRNEDYLI